MLQDAKHASVPFSLRRLCHKPGGVLAISSNPPPNTMFETRLIFLASASPSPCVPRLFCLLCFVPVFLRCSSCFTFCVSFSLQRLHVICVLPPIAKSRGALYPTQTFWLRGVESCSIRRSLAPMAAQVITHDRWQASGIVSVLPD